MSNLTYVEYKGNDNDLLIISVWGLERQKLIELRDKLNIPVVENEG
jgi:hypothetical protein